MRTARGLILLVLAGVSIACSAAQGTGETSSTGDVGVLLVFGPFRVDSAHYLLTNGKSSYGGDLQVHGEDTLSAKIDGIVAAGGYDLIVTAEAPDGSFRCAGDSGSFAVSMGKTVRVALGFHCLDRVASRDVAPPPNQWEVNECPDILSVVADHAEGCSIRMHVNASDPDHKPQPLDFSWSNGMTGPSPSLDCQAEGPVDLTVTVSDGDSVPGCDATFEVKVICPAGCGAPLDEDGRDGFSPMDGEAGAYATTE